jgi:hypothetical protein
MAQEKRTSDASDINIVKQAVKMSRFAMSGRGFGTLRMSEKSRSETPWLGINLRKASDAGGANFLSKATTWLGLRRKLRNARLPRQRATTKTAPISKSGTKESGLLRESNQLKTRSEPVARIPMVMRNSCPPTERRVEIEFHPHASQ